MTFSLARRRLSNLSIYTLIDYVDSLHNSGACFKNLQKCPKRMLTRKRSRQLVENKGSVSKNESKRRPNEPVEKTAGEGHTRSCLSRKRLHGEPSLLPDAAVRARSARTCTASRRPYAPPSRPNLNAGDNELHSQAVRQYAALYSQDCVGAGRGGYIRVFESVPRGVDIKNVPLFTK